MNVEAREPSRLTRKQFLRSAGAAAGAAAVGGGAYGVVRLTDGGAADPAPLAAHHFRSRPDLRPPGVGVTGRATGNPPYLLLSPSAVGGRHVSSQPGALIVDGRGEPVWFQPVGRDYAANLQVGSYGGAPVITWWQGGITPLGYGRGFATILDGRYREVAKVRAGNRRSLDLHELTLTPQGTALITCYPRTVEADLRTVGGPARGQVLENFVQEIDIQTGRVLMEWRSLDGIAVGESYHPYHEPYDYLHANSVGLTPDGHLLVSARHTWAIYKLHRRTGEVIWRLGGKRSDFELPREARFSWQHDARQLSSSTLTLFDDGSDGPSKTERQSRALILDVDTSARRVRLARALGHPRKSVLAAAMGNVQTLPDGGLVVGWGIVPRATQYGSDGRPLAEFRLPRHLYSYRAFRFPWDGQPNGAPAVAIARDKRSAYASWNGATAVTHWQVRAGTEPSSLRRVATVRRDGFETAIPLNGARGLVGIAALDRNGQTLGVWGPRRI